MTPRASTEPPHLGHLETGAVQSLQLEFRNFDISTLHAHCTVSIDTSIHHGEYDGSAKLTA